MSPTRDMFRAIAAIALPAIIANITTPLMSLMDVAITGHLGGADYIAAIAIGGTLFNVVYWLMGFLRMGTSGLTAQAYGATDNNESQAILMRSLIVSVAIGVAIIALQKPLCDIGLAFMDADGETREYARRYFMICTWGAPAVLATYSLTGWFLGMQNARIPMIISIAVNLINVGVSLLLTAVFHMQIAGVAAGTLTAQWAGAIIGLWIWRCRFKSEYSWMTVQVTGKELRRFFSVNRDIFLRTACLVAVTLWFTRAGSMQGPVILAANTLLMQLFTLFSYFMDGFAYSGEALCGRFRGAGDNDRLRLCIRSLVALGVVFSLIFTLVSAALGRDGLLLLTSDVNVADVAMRYFPAVLAVPLCGFMAFTYDGICIGLTRTRAMLISMACATFIFFAAWFTLTPVWGNSGLWSAFLLYLAIRSSVLPLLCHRKWSA
ncbi:MAG: MATE family efflux transporter [Muribaculum sp.]|nr:MATE family efflux transporter [Muribaculum sp.]